MTEDRKLHVYEYKAPDGTSAWMVIGIPGANGGVEVSSDRARRFASLKSHQDTLESCIEGIQEFRRAGDRAGLRNLLLTAIIVKFFSCFARNTVGAPLVSHKVFDGDEANMNTFKLWKAVRDDHIAHDENTMSQSTTIAALNQHGDLVEVFALTAKMDFATDETLNENLFNIIVAAKAWVEKSASDAKASVVDELKALSSEQRLRLRRPTLETANHPFEKRKPRPSK